jgi:hypothetical protein
VPDASASETPGDVGSSEPGCFVSSDIYAGSSSTLTLRLADLSPTESGRQSLVNTAVTASKRRKRKRIIAKRCSYYLMATMISRNFSNCGKVSRGKQTESSGSAQSNDDALRSELAAYQPHSRNSKRLQVENVRDKLFCQDVFTRLPFLPDHQSI